MLNFSIFLFLFLNEIMLNFLFSKIRNTDNLALKCNVDMFVYLHINI